MLSCPRISSRVIVIIQKRDRGICSEQKSTVWFPIKPCVILSLERAVGGFIAGQRSFSARGGLFRACFQPLAQRGRGEESKSPRAVTLGLLTAPRGERLHTFKKSPPPPSTHTPTPIPSCLVNSQHHQHVPKTKRPKSHPECKTSARPGSTKTIKHAVLLDKHKCFLMLFTTIIGFIFVFF